MTKTKTNGTETRIIFKKIGRKNKREIEKIPLFIGSSAGMSIGDFSEDKNDTEAIRYKQTFFPEFFLKKKPSFTVSFYNRTIGSLIKKGREFL